MVLQSSGRAPAWNQCHRDALFWGSQQEPTLTRGCVPVYPALFSKEPRVSLMLRAGLYMRKPPPHTCVCLHISFPCDQVSMYIEKKLSKLSCHLVVTTCEKFYVLKLRKNPSHSLRKPFCVLHLTLPPLLWPTPFAFSGWPPDVALVSVLELNVV